MKFLESFNAAMTVISKIGDIAFLHKMFFSERDSTSKDIDIMANRVDLSNPTFFIRKQFKSMNDYDICFLLMLLKQRKKLVLRQVMFIL